MNIKVSLRIRMHILFFCLIIIFLLFILLNQYNIVYAEPSSLEIFQQRQLSNQIEIIKDTIENASKQDLIAINKCLQVFKPVIDNQGNLWVSSDISDYHSLNLQSDFSMRTFFSNLGFWFMFVMLSLFLDGSFYFISYLIFDISYLQIMALTTFNQMTDYDQINRSYDLLVSLQIIKD